MAEGGGSLYFPIKNLVKIGHQISEVQTQWAHRIEKNKLYFRINKGLFKYDLTPFYRLLTPPPYILTLFLGSTLQRIYKGLTQSLDDI